MEKKMEEILKLITTYGFPVVISIYLLFRMEQKLTTLQSAIEKLSEVIARCQFTNNIKAI